MTSDAEDQQHVVDSLRPLAHELAFEAFRTLDRNTFSVSAQLSVDDPASLRDFALFERILLDAYQKGYQAGQVKAA